MVDRLPLIALRGAAVLLFGIGVVEIWYGGRLAFLGPTVAIGRPNVTVVQVTIGVMEQVLVGTLALLASVRLWRRHSAPLAVAVTITFLVGEVVYYQTLFGRTTWVAFRSAALPAGLILLGVMLGFSALDPPEPGPDALSELEP